MKPAPFAYAAPMTIAETLHLLAQHGEDARIIAGGQTLGPMLNMRMATPSVLVDINRVTDFASLVETRDQITMGALVRQREALDDFAVAASVPLLRAALPHVGHFQTRNRGTVCGSIAHADPTAELPLALLTLGGSVSLASARRRRSVAADAFFLGALTTAREPDEMILDVGWPKAAADMGFSFEEVGVRHGHVAVVACAIAASLDDNGTVTSLSIGLTGIGDRPVLLDAWQFLGTRPDGKWRDAIAAHARSSVDFISDLHASGPYRRHVAGWLVARGLERAARRPVRENAA